MTKLLDISKRLSDPMLGYPFLVGVRERKAGDPRKRNHPWLTPQQQAAWEEGWDLMDELMRLKQDTGW